MRKNRLIELLFLASFLGDDSMPSGNHYSRTKQGSKHFIQPKEPFYCQASREGVEALEQIEKNPITNLSQSPQGQ